MGDMVRETPNADLSGDLVSQPKEYVLLIGVLFHQKDEIGECEEKRGKRPKKTGKKEKTREKKPQRPNS